MLQTKNSNNWSFIVFKKLKINVNLLTDVDKRRQKATDNEQNGIFIRTKNKTLFYDI